MDIRVPEPTPRRFYGMAELAELLSCSQRTVTRYMDPEHCKARGLVPLRRGRIDGRVGAFAEDLDEWINCQRKAS